MGVFWLEEFIDGWLEQRTMIRASNISVARRKAEKMSKQNNSDLRIIKGGVLLARKTSSKLVMLD